MSKQDRPTTYAGLSNFDRYKVERGTRDAIDALGRTANDGELIAWMRANIRDWWYGDELLGTMIAMWR